jgi:hypothetical protein
MRVRFPGRYRRLLWTAPGSWGGVRDQFTTGTGDEAVRLGFLGEIRLHAPYKTVQNVSLGQR